MDICPVSWIEMCWTVLVSTTHPVLTFSYLSPQPFVTCTQWEPCFWSLETRLPGSSPRSGECPFSFVHKGHKTRPPVQSFCDTKQDLTNTVQSTINQKVLNTSSLFTSSVTTHLWSSFGMSARSSTNTLRKVACHSRHTGFSVCDWYYLIS